MLLSTHTARQEHSITVLDLAFRPQYSSCYSITRRTLLLLCSASFVYCGHIILSAFRKTELLLCIVDAAMQQRAAERERLRKEREERKRKLEHEKLVLLLQALSSWSKNLRVSATFVSFHCVMHTYA